MMKAINAKEFEMVAAWSVDGLGRSLTDLLAILQALRDKGVDLFLHQQGLLLGHTAPRQGALCGPGSPGTTLPAGAEPSEQIRRKLPPLVRDFLKS
jgi:resolvase-like protein